MILLGSMIGYWMGLHQHLVELSKATFLALLAGFGTLGGYLWRQFRRIKNRKLSFMHVLTQNLYFKNLDNNAGAFYRLVDEAVEEVCKEALLVYYFLLANDHPVSQSALDNKIETWFADEWDCKIDFEIDDVLDNLINTGLVVEKDNLLRAMPLADAIMLLDKQWDNYFVS